MARLRRPRLASGLKPPSSSRQDGGESFHPGKTRRPRAKQPGGVFCRDAAEGVGGQAPGADHGGETMGPEGTACRPAAAVEHRGNQYGVGSGAARPQDCGQGMSRDSDEKSRTGRLQASCSVGHPLRKMGARLPPRPNGVGPDQQDETTRKRDPAQFTRCLSRVAGPESTIDETAAARQTPRQLDRIRRSLGIGDHQQPRQSGR